MIFAGKVITASFTPSQIQPGSPDWDPCSQRGSGKLYIFDLKTGRGVFDDGAGGEQRFSDIGAGLPTDPKISIGVGGDDNKIVIQKSGTEVKILDAEDVSYGRGIIYWREQIASPSARSERRRAKHRVGRAHDGDCAIGVAISALCVGLWRGRAAREPRRAASQEFTESAATARRSSNRCASTRPSPRRAPRCTRW